MLSPFVRLIFFRLIIFQMMEALFSRIILENLMDFGLLLKIYHLGYSLHIV